MTRESGRFGRLTRRLGFRLGVSLALALVPLGLIAVLQAQNLITEARARSEAALMGATLHAAAPQIATIRLAQGAADALAVAIPDLVGDTAACGDVMKGLVDRSEARFSFAGFIPADGFMVCSSSGEPLDLRASARFQAMIADPKPALTVNPKGPVSGQSVLVASTPVRDKGGYIGFVSVSMPHASLSVAGETAGAAPGVPGEPVVLLTLDQHGTVLTSSLGLDAAARLMPADIVLGSNLSAGLHAFTARAKSGQFRTYSIVPLEVGALFALGTWPSDDVALLGRYAKIGPLIFPVLMCLASLAVAWLATEQLVARHIRALSRSITAFARGSRTVRPLNVADAPFEIQEVAVAYSTMTETILHDEAELENTIHQKEVLLREVHHRVKNNLQLIASIMNIQLRLARSPETKESMRTLRDRVMSLATIHRELYQTSGLTDVHADELLSDILRQVVNMGTGPGRPFDVEQAFEPLRLTPDQAVPLALFMTEALTNALKYAVAGADGRAKLAVRLSRLADARAVLVIENSFEQGAATPAGSVVDERPSGLGSQLISGFAQQLGAEAVTTTEAGLYRMSLEFDMRPLADAEARRAAVPAAEAADAAEAAGTAGADDGAGPLPASH